MTEAWSGGAGFVSEHPRIHRVQARNLEGLHVRIEDRESLADPRVRAHIGLIFEAAQREPEHGLLVGVREPSQPVEDVFRSSWLMAQAATSVKPDAATSVSAWGTIRVSLIGAGTTAARFARKAVMCAPTAWPCFSARVTRAR